MASRNIQYKGSFDVSQILASFRQIRDEAAKSNISDKLLGGYDKELEKVEKLTTQILAAQSRGLTDNLSIKEFARLVSQLEKQYGILNVKAQAFTDAANYKTETAEIKQYSTQLKTLIDRLKSLEKSARDYIDANSDSLKLSKEESKALKLSISDAQAYKDILDEIVEKRIEAAKLKVTKLSLDATGGQLKYADITSLNRGFTVSAAARKANDPSRQSAVNKKGLFNEDFALLKANEEYNRILEKTIKEGKDAETAILELTKVMKAYRVELGDTDEIQERFANDIKEIREAALADYSNLSGSAKGKFTLANNNLDRIRNSALDLYNNGDVGKVELVAKEAEETSSRLAAALNQLELAIDNTIEKERELAATAGKTAQELVDGCKNVLKEALKYVSILDSILAGFDRIGQGAKQILSVTTSWRALRNVVKSTFNDIKDLDKAFGSIAMVTSYSVKDMWSLYDQYAAMANKLGLSTKSVVEASALYYQQGLKTNEVMLLTEETMKLATLAGLDFKDATSQMTAALRAFHMDMSEGAHVTDVYAEVAAHAAVDVQGLSEAMSACASIANSSGMAFETTTAMLATMTEATQEAPKNLGTALKTVLARFTELKTNVAGTADSEFDDLDYNKVDKALKSVGVLLKDTNGLFRNMDDVLLELSSKWSSLDRNSLRYIATIAAGSRQQSRFIALMENYERTMQLVDVALNSAGRSSLQFAKYLDTVEYRLNQISNTWELFKTGLLSSDFYKDVLDNFNSFLNKLNDMSVAGLATLAGTWMTFGRKAISGNLNMISSGVGLIFTGDKAQSKFYSQNLSNKAYFSKTEDGTELLDTKLLEKGWEELKAKSALKGLAIGTAIATSITAGVTATLTSDSAGEAALKSAGMSVMSNVMAGAQAFGWQGAVAGLILTGITAAISGVATWLKNAAEEREARTNEKLLASAEKLLENILKKTEELKNELKNNKDELKSLEDIKKAYDELKDKLYLTTEEQEKFNNLVDTLLNDYPELIEVYDEENKKLKISNDLLEDKITKTQKLADENAKALVNLSALENITEKKLEILKNKVDFKEDFKNYFKDLVFKGENDLGKEYVLNKDTLAEAIYDYYLRENGDIEKTIEAFEEQAPDNLGVDIAEISATLKGFFNKYKTDNKINFKETAKTNIQTSSNELIKNVNENTKDSLAIALNEVYNKRYEKSSKSEEFSLVTTPGKYTKLKEEEQQLGISKIASLGSEQFKAKFNAPGQNGKYLKETIDAIISGNYDYDEYSDKDKELLNLLGITNADELKDFNKLYKTKTEKSDVLISKLLAAAIGSNLLSDEDIKKVTALDLKLQDIYNSDMNIALAEASIKKIREESKDITGADEIIKKYEKDKDEYESFLKRYNISDTKWKDVSILLGKAIEDNLGKYLDGFDLDTSSQKKLANSLYDSIKNSGLEGEALNALFDIDYAELSKGTYEDAVKIILERLEAADDKFKDTGEAAAREYLDGLSGKGLVSFITKSADTLNKTINQALEKKLDFSESFGEVLSKTLSDLKTLGHIDMSNLKDIQDKITSMGLNPDDFIKATDLGNFGLDYDALVEAAEKLLGTEEDFIKKKEEERDLGIAQLQLEINMLKAKRTGNSVEDNTLTVEEKITDEKEAQARLQAYINKQALDEITSIVNNLKRTNSEDSEDFKKALDAEIEAKEKLLEALQNVNIEEQARNQYRATKNYFNELKKTYEEGLEDFKKSNDDAYDDWLDKVDAVKDAQKSLAEAIETVKEKQKELADVIKGTGWESSLDGMYNYDTALDALTKKTERAKEELDKSMDEAGAKRNALIYGLSLLDLKANIQAQIEVYKKAIANYNKTYREKLGPELNKWEEQSKTKFDPSKYVNLNNKTGRYEISMDKLQKDLLPKEVKSWIEEYIKTVNEYLGKIEDFLDQEKELDEEYLEWKKQVRDDYIDLQQKMMDVLREKYQKEIDDLLNKYDAMEEADLNYLDALLKNLDKQRKLRDLEKNWRELTDKERKLSLMLRDTSRGNIGEVKSLEKEVEDLRTSLLDTAVDDIIEKLQEFYDLLKESRDAEIEYKETLLSDVNLLKEVTEELKKIHTSQDLVNWWKKNVSNIALMSEEEFNREKDEWSNLIKAKQTYSASIDKTFEKSIENAEGKLRDVAEETEKVVKTTSEEITNLADVTLQEAADEYKEALKAAKEALLDAVDAVETLRKALLSAIEAAEAAKKSFDDIHKAYMEHLAKEGNKTVTVYQVGGTTLKTLEEGKRNIESLPFNERTEKAIVTPTLVTLEEADKIKDTTPKNSTLPKSVISKVTRYMGINDKGEIMFYENKDDFNQYNPYKYNGEVEIEKYADKGKINYTKHGVLEYKPTLCKWVLIKDFDKKSDAEKYLEENVPTVSGPYDALKAIDYRKYHKAFAEGGLVDYTGPAWVDGSRSRPEAFLSAEDTRRIGEAARILADLPILSQPVKEQIPTTTTIGDTTIQIDVHVDSIANDYDLDEAMNKVEQRIVNAAKYAGSNVILKKH